MKSKDRNDKRIRFSVIIMLTVFICFCIDTPSIKAAALTNLKQAATGQAIDMKSSSNTLYPATKLVNGMKKYGYIDETGKFVLQPIYETANNFYNNVAIVRIGNLNKVIDRKGRVLFQTEGRIADFHNGMAAFSVPKDKFYEGYINTKGKVVIKPSYRTAWDFEDNGTAFVHSKEGKYLRIDKKGKVFKTYPYAKKYGNDGLINDGYVIFIDKNLFGVADLDGNIIYKPIYGEISYLGNNLFGMKKKLTDPNLGLLQKMPAAIFNSDGKQLTPYSLYDLSSYTGNYASYTDSKSTYFVDLKGRRVSSLPQLKGRGTMKVLGDVIQADIDDELIYMKTDGSVIWKYDSSYQLSSTVTVRTYKFKPNKYALVYYPKIEGLSDTSVQQSINNQLKNIFIKYRKNLKEKDNLVVDDSFTAKQMKDLLIINRSGYDYYFGGAHGTPLRDHFIINLKTGELYELKDLFKDNSYRLKLSNIIKKQMKDKMKKGEAGFFPDSFKSIKLNQKFYVKEDRLVLYFDSCEISAYAAGFPEFEIPFKDIMNMINTEGSFWKAFK